MAKRKRRPHLRSGAEVDGLREAGHLAAEVLRLASDFIAPGKTTKEVDEYAGQLIAERGCTSAFLGYRGFPGITCISMNEEIVHGIGSDRVIEEGEVVKLDVGLLTPDRWIGDNAKSIPVGDISSDDQELLRRTEESLYAAIENARAGNPLSAICRSVEAYVVPYGYTVVKEFVGHGVGRDLHEEPQIPNYWDKAEMRYRRFPDVELKPGMVLAIEPMVNAGTEEIEVLSDNWTVITRDKALSSHYEHTVLVTEGDPEILTPRERMWV